MNEKFDTLKSVSDYTVNLINGIEKAVEYFHAGEDRKACDLVLPISEGIEWINNDLME